MINRKPGYWPLLPSSYYETDRYHLNRARSLERLPSPSRASRARSVSPFSRSYDEERRVRATSLEPLQRASAERESSVAPYYEDVTTPSRNYYYWRTYPTYYNYYTPSSYYDSDYAPYVSPYHTRYYGKYYSPLSDTYLYNYRRTPLAMTSMSSGYVPLCLRYPYLYSPLRYRYI